MKMKIQNVTVEGTPEEIYQLLSLTNAAPRVKKDWNFELLKAIKEKQLGSGVRIVTVGKAEDYPDLYKRTN